MKYSLILFIISTVSLNPTFSQTEDPINRHWNAFYTKIDIKNHRGSDFKLSASIKADTMSKKSSAHLWVRVDKTNGKTGFFNNMMDKPIKENTWRTYSIEGKIDNKADSLVFGGLYFNRGRYYFKDFELMLKKKNGTWVNVELQAKGIGLKEFVQVQVQGFDFQAGNYEKGLGPLIVDGENNYSYGNNSSKGKYVNLNGIEMYYEVYGQGDPLILLHGNSQSIGAFDKQIPELSKKHKVIAVDTRGQGNSTENGKDLTYELFASDILALLNHLNLKSVNLLGWSDGGNTGLILAMNHPERIKKLAVMGAVLYNDNTSIKSNVNSHLKKEINERKDEDSFEMRMLLLLLNEPNIKPENLNKIVCPVLVMAGSKDMVKEPHTKLIADNIDQSKLVIFENGTHYEPTENPERFNKAVIQFFDDK